MKKAFTIIRVSAEDQLKGSGPEDQWRDDVMPNAPLLGLEVDEGRRRVIQESATGWERVRFEATVREVMSLHQAGRIEALLFPRVDRETRFVFGSMPLLVEIVQSGLEVYFAREKLRLDPNDSESVERYLSKATQAQAYVETMKINTARGKRRRVLQDGKLPTGRGMLYGYDYDKRSGQNTANAFLDNVRVMGLWVLQEGAFLNEVCRRLMFDLRIPAPKGGLQWSRSTVGRILRNPAYAGKSYAGKTAIINGRRVQQPRDQWVETPNAVDRVAFTWEEWEGIQCQLDRNQELSPRNQKLHYPLRNRVYCQQCGRKYRGVPIHGKPYYRCSGRSRLVVATPCRSRSVNAGWLWELVWAQIASSLRDPDLLLTELERAQDTGENVTHLEGQIQRLGKQLMGYDESLDRYLRMYGAGLYSFDRLEREVNRVKADQAKVETEKRRIENRVAEARQSRLDAQGVERALDMMATSIDAASEDDKNLALEALDIKVWVDTDSVRIEGFLPVTNVVTVSQPL